MKRGHLLADDFYPSKIYYCCLALLPVTSYGFITWSYLSAHQFPAYGGGLFQAMATAIQFQGYQLPTYIPWYLDGQIPFAYPPAAFYVIAVVRDLTGLSGVWMALYGSLIMTAILLVVFARFSNTLLDSWAAASIATTCLAMMPHFFRLHISAGGIVRALGFTLALFGVTAGLRVYRDGDKEQLKFAALGFGLTTLTHPIYSGFCGLSIFVFYLYFDRKRSGLWTGMKIASMGLLITLPWFATVMMRHGAGIYLGATNTQNIFPNSLATAFDSLLYWDIIFDSGLTNTNIWIVCLLVTTIVAAYLKEWLVPAWILLLGLVFNLGRFQYALAAVLIGWVAKDLTQLLSLKMETWKSQGIVSSLVAIMLVIGLLSGIAYANNGSKQPGWDEKTMVSFVDGADLAAMNWVQHSTSPSASFVVIGNTAEWFPQITHRRTLASVRGSEWLGGQAFQHQKQIALHLARCSDAICINRILIGHGLKPDYVYIPTGEYSRVYSYPTRQAPNMSSEIRSAAEFTVVYENDGVIVAKFRSVGS